MIHNSVLVLGASGGLGQAMVKKFLADPKVDLVVAVSQQIQASVPELPVRDDLVWIQSEYHEQAMAEVIVQLDPFKATFSRVCICHGILHDADMRPEKRFEDVSAEVLRKIFQANSIVPALWLKLLHRILQGKQACIVAVFSARVGSTADNRLGGWYAYRASKAALNSLLQTYAVEYARRAKNIKLIAFHPGTTDTQLSKPFQASVPEGKLFTTDFVADQLAQIMASAELDGQLSFLDWEGKTIPF